MGKRDRWKTQKSRPRGKLTMARVFAAKHINESYVREGLAGAVERSSPAPSVLVFVERESWPFLGRMRSKGPMGRPDAGGWSEPKRRRGNAGASGRWDRAGTLKNNTVSGAGGGSRKVSPALQTLKCAIESEFNNSYEKLSNHLLTQARSGFIKNRCFVDGRSRLLA